jgi:putative membrane protein insertion efficiency factor
MILKKTIFIIIVCLSSTTYGLAQSRAEVAIMKGAYLVPAKPNYVVAKGNTNELQYLFSGMFLFYKTFISSQDGQSCSFRPSCSEYGIRSIKKHGVFLGVMATFDRLARCNGLSPEKYPVDTSTGLLIDEVE